VRLTEKKNNGHWSLKGVSWNELKPGAVLSEKTWEKLYGALWKLKGYEDTGVSPDEIERMKTEGGKMLVMIDENGVADVYDDTYDIVIHCESEEDQKDAKEALKEIRRWIPVTEKLPEPETYILVSFDNFTLPGIATYRVDDDGSGAFYPGDEDYTYLSVGFYVNAWMPLPGVYRAEVEEKPVAGTGWKDHYMGRFEKVE
jgi:hypothetical protein